MICLRQQIEGGRIAEEVRDVDEEILGEQLALAGILAQDLQIAARCSRCPPSPCAARSGVAACPACRARNHAGSSRPRDR